jgi:hypothetical protein
VKKPIIATIVLFCAILVVVWYLSEQAHPVMIDVDPAHLQHR